MEVKINYVTIASDQLGSFRYNIKTPGMELSKMGHEVTVSYNPLKDKDAYVFHKHLREDDPFIMKMAKKDNPKSKTYYIVSDYHLDNRLRNHYQTMINKCDQLVVCTEAMRKVLRDETGKDSVVIKDPWGIEFDEKSPNFVKKKDYRLLWFGSKTNADGLLDNVCNIPDNYHLTLVTDRESGFYDFKGKISKVIQYTPERLKEQLANCDVIIIPNDHTKKSKNVKTHNRLVDAIRAGKPVIASPIAAYIELNKYAWVGDIKEGFKWLEGQSPEAINSMISSGQEYIKTEFSPKVIAKKWETLFSEGLCQ